MTIWMDDKCMHDLVNYVISVNQKKKITMVWYGAVHKHKWTLFVKKYVLNVKAITIQWNRIMESTSIFRRTNFFFVVDYEWFKLKSTLACTCIALVLHYVVFNDVGTGSINIKKNAWRGGRLMHSYTHNFSVVATSMLLCMIF